MIESEESRTQERLATHPRDPPQGIARERENTPLTHLSQRPYLLTRPKNSKFDQSPNAKAKIDNTDKSFPPSGRVIKALLTDRLGAHLRSHLGRGR